MKSSLPAIYIPQLAKAQNRAAVFEVDTYLPALETLTPVKGSLRVVHQGNYLEVTAHAETIVTLSCDRCLQQYNHRLEVDTTELIWLRASDAEFQPLEQDIEPDELVETLLPNGHFEPDTWLYEHLCLALPPQQLCNDSCTGLLVTAEPPPLVDHRWRLLEQLRDQMPTSPKSDEGG